ncbi:MAG: hypothetical protein IKF01_02085 [Bacilli bacterium]|nr:hypothetical protein [Bacilli bacterium]
MKKLKLFGVLLVVVSGFLIGNNVVKGESPFYNITGLFLKNSEVGAGERIYVDLYMIHKDSSTNITGYFSNGKGSDIGLQLKDINKNPYFEVSNFMKPGDTYTLTSIKVVDSKDSITYSMIPGGPAPGMNPLGKNVVSIKAQDKLKHMELVGNSLVDSKGKMTIKLETDVNCDYISVNVRNKTIPSMSSIVYLNKTSNNYYELNLSTGSDKLTSGDYYISDVFMFEKNTTTHYSYNSIGDDVLPLNYQVEFQIIDNEKTEDLNVPDLLKAISVNSVNAKLNEKVNVNIDTTKDLSSATLIFSNEKESMIVNLKNLNSIDTYFVIPFTTNAGTYNLDYAILKDVNGKEYQYRKGEDYHTVKHFDFNSSITVVNEIAGGDLLNLDNSKMTADVLEKIKALESNIVIEVNANDNPIILKELFETIKDSNKTIIIKYRDLEWTFNGLDIKKPKQIDVSTNIYNVSEDSDISSRVEEGFVLDFADNDELPGKCLIKVYNSDIISKIMNKNNANVYYYNEETNKFEIIKLNTEYSDNGYYEFYINHNSKYVVTSKKIEDKYMSGKKITEKSNKDSKLALFIAVPSIILVIVVIIIIFVKKKKKVNNS